MASPAVTGPWPGLKAFFAGSFGDAGDWSPLVTLGHWLLYRVFGDEPFGYRLTSLLLHALVSVLVYRAVSRRVGREDIAFAAAFLWVLFPSHSEVLAQTSFKKHQLVALFGLLMLESRRTGMKVGLFCAALLCRESALMLLPLAFIDSFLSKDGVRKSRAPLSVMAVVAVVYAVAHAALLPRALTAPMGGSLINHLLSAAKILAWHLGQFAAPVSQCQEHSLAPASASSPASWAVLVGLGGAAYAAFRLSLKDKAAAFGLAWALLFIAPFLNLLPYLNFSLVANRYHYMASAGFLLLAARLAERAKPAPRAVLAATAAVALGYAAVGLRHSALYAAPLELWAQTAACAPDNPRARSGHGAALRAEGRLEEARAELNRAVALDPSFSEPLVDLTWVNAELGRPEEALAAARKRLELRADAVGYASLGALELSLGRHEDACPRLAKAFALAPGAEAAYSLGQCRAAAGRLDEAEMNLRLAAAEPRLRAKALAELAGVLERAGRRDDAAAVLEESLGLAPLQPDALARLAGLYAKRGEKARALALYDSLIARLEAPPSERARELAAAPLAELRKGRALLAR